MKKLFTVVLAAGMAVLAQAQILRTTVQQGEIEGDLHNGYALYKAIPYAEAPVGDLRWKKPVPKKAWEGVYKADNYGKQPFQPGDPGRMSEDCLYLCVETPAQSKDDKLPVFVNIHGGAFATGSYGGTQDSFVKEGIVYVSIEYRLGALGFLAHPEMSKESPEKISGNYGIYDQICALQWIHDNIAAFGGDPEKVTIAGESAGGISVSILCGSPLCKGLFRAAISESGGSFCPMSPTGASANCKDFRVAEKDGSALQAKLGVKNLKQMRKLDAADIIKASSAEQYWPVVDGIAITDDQYKNYLKGDYNDVDVLIGYNSDEGSLFVYQQTMEQYEKQIQDYFGDWADEAKIAYPASNDKEALWAIQDIFRDNAFGWPTWAWGNLQTKTGKGKVYMFYFDQKAATNMVPNSRGASHVAEMPFIYGWGWPRLNEMELHMGQIMSRYWINFTKTGDPNGDELPYWTTYKQGEPTVLYMHNGFQLIPAPNQKQMEFWEEYFTYLRDTPPAEK